MTDVLAHGNTALTIIFTLEVALKIKGLGWDGFRADSFNSFDAAVVGISLLELLVGSGGGSGFTLVKTSKDDEEETKGSQQETRSIINPISD